MEQFDSSHINFAPCLSVLDFIHQLINCLTRCYAKEKEIETT
jgi:hypothetical protein